MQTDQDLINLKSTVATVDVKSIDPVASEKTIKNTLKTGVTTQLAQFALFGIGNEVTFISA